MQLFIGWLLIIFPGILFIGQILLAVNFSLNKQVKYGSKKHRAPYLNRYA